MIKRAILSLVPRVPAAAREWLYRHPPLAIWASRFLKRLLPTNGVQIVTVQAGPNAGMKLAMDQKTPRYYWLRGHDEPEVLYLFQKQIKAGMFVLDVGAHVGIETMLFSRLVGPNGRVVSFEPDPSSIQLLRQNCELNALSNVEVRCEAVTDKSGVAVFQATGEVTSKLAVGTEEAGGIEVELIALDEAIEQLHLTHLEFIKIDVEDFEVDVLRGAKAVLAKLKPVLLIEIHSLSSLRGCQHLLDDADYVIAAVPTESPLAKLLVTTGEDAPPFERGHIFCRPRVQQ